MSFFLGAVTGLATNLDKGLQDSLQKTDERIEKASLRIGEERRLERKKLREQEDAIEEVLSGIGSFVDTSKLPEGVTVEDAAAAIFANQAGGSISRGTTLVSALSESQLKGRDPALVLDKVKATGMSPSDIRKQFLDFPELTTPAPVMGSGFLKKKNLTDDIMAAVDEPALPTAPTERADFGMAQFDLSKTAMAEAAERQRKLTDLDILNARLTMQKTTKEIAEEGGLSVSDQRVHMKDALESAAKVKDVKIVDGVIQFQTSEEAFENSKEAVAFALQGITQYFIDTNTMRKTSAKNSIKGFISANGGFLRTAGRAAIKDGAFDPEGMEVGKLYSYKTKGQNLNGLWLGNEMLAVTGIERE